MIHRHEIEERERRFLAPYAMKAAESRGRAHPEKEHPYRTAFQRDRDRIIHSTAFRRLEYKTQVFVNHEGDYYRTRLTHTMEVAQIARSVARALAANEDLTEAVSLSHDLGHTPFGHSGQDALNAILREVDPETEPKRFEHNRQSLRIVDELERRYPGFAGLNLSYEVRESIAKHSKGSGGASFAGIDVAGRSLLEAQLADLADSIAYDHHDVDDGLKSGLLTEEALAGVRLWSDACAAVRARHPDLPPETRRVTVVRFLIDQAVTKLVENTWERLRAADLKSPDDVRAWKEPLAAFPADYAKLRREMQAFLHGYLYGHYRVRRMQIKAERFLREMFAEYHRNPDQLPTEYRLRVEADPAGKKQVIADYVAGMTDRFAQEEYKRLFHPFERM